MELYVSDCLTVERPTATKRRMSREKKPGTCVQREAARFGGADDLNDADELNDADGQ